MEARNDELHGQLAGLVGLKFQASIGALDLLHIEAQKPSASRICASSGVVGKVRPGRQGNVQSLEIDLLNMDGLAGTVVERRVETELVETEERRAGFLRGRCELSGGPDTQPLTVGPQAVHQRDMEGIKLDAGMKPLLQLGDNAGAQKGLGPMQQDGNYAGRYHQSQ